MQMGGTARLTFLPSIYRVTLPRCAQMFTSRTATSHRAAVDMLRTVWSTRQDNELLTCRPRQTSDLQGSWPKAGGVLHSTCGAGGRYGKRMKYDLLT